MSFEALKVKGLGITGVEGLEVWKSTETGGSRHGFKFWVQGLWVTVPGWGDHTRSRVPGVIN